MSRPEDCYRIGLVIPLQGPAGLFAPSCEAAAELAVAMVNESGGICGRPVALEVIEGGDEPAAVARRVDTAIRQGRVEAITGWHISAVRHTVAPVVRDRIPYVYTSLYEGGEQRREVICSGEVPAQQIRPALVWLRQHLGIRRWAIVGDDYVWPRASAALTRRYCRDLGLTVMDEIFVTYGTTDLFPAVQRVARSGADGVLMLLVGQDAVLFNREFAAWGLDGHIARFTPLMEENMLLASGAGATDNLFVAAGYFNSLATADALELMGAYTDRFGVDAPPLNNMAESCHEGILVLRSLHEAAASCELSDLVRARDRVRFDGPRGPVSLTGTICRQRIHLARADGLHFDVVDRLGSDVLS